MIKNIHVRNILLFAVFSLAIMGCSKVTQENYDRIKSGMTYEEVKKILGDPTNCESGLGIKSCVWQHGEKKIDIKILADQVIFLTSKNL